MRRIAAILGLLVALTTVAPENGAADSRNWSLTNIRGRTFHLTDALSDGPVLLVFWATWCIPCKKEIHDSRDFFNDLVEKGCQVLLVSENTTRTQSKVKPYIESKGYPWDALLDPDGEVLKRYGGTSLPYTVLLDRNGNAAYKIRGVVTDRRALISKVETLLGAGSE